MDHAQQLQCERQNQNHLEAESDNLKVHHPVGQGVWRKVEELSPERRHRVQESEGLLYESDEAFWVSQWEEL
jgi:hypothetical protein